MRLTLYFVMLVAVVFGFVLLFIGQTSGSTNVFAFTAAIGALEYVSDRINEGRK